MTQQTSYSRNLKLGSQHVRISLAYVFLSIWAALQVWPIVWMFYSSFKDQADIFANRWLPPFPPLTFHPENWEVAWSGGFEGITVGRYLANSVVVTSVSLTITVLVAVTAGYSLARLNIKGARTMFYFFLTLIAIPPPAIVIPLYVLLRDWGMVNQYVGLILPYVAYNVPFSVVIARAFFVSFPSELEESARIDGCGVAGSFWRIVLPLSRNLLATLAVVSFPAIWNELLFAYVVMSNNEMKTLGPGLMGYVGQYYTRYDYMFAGLSIAIIPLIVFYLLFQGQIVKGVTAGAVKG
jgi:raffinose/stachyose/melibiose transport system permease protein